MLDASPLYGTMESLGNDWLTGFGGPLHPNAFRDIFLSFTGVAVIIAVVMPPWTH